MSQEKVDRYKKEKENRKKIMKKEKAKSFAARMAGAIVCLALIGWDWLFRICQMGVLASRHYDRD